MKLETSPQALTCPQGHRFDVVEGVPVMLVQGPQTQWVAEASLTAAASGAGSDPYFIGTLGGIQEPDREAIRREMSQPERYAVDPVVRHVIAATGGHLYRSLVGRLTSYPIPVMPLGKGGGRLLLDIGCNWGRWSIAAARRGYRAIGIDPSLGAVLAARRASRDCGVAAEFLVADARYLPFPNGLFDAVFSYSVLQHFSQENLAAAVGEIARVLKRSGECLVQMANCLGVRSLYHQARRRFRAAAAFEVRYWRPTELRRVFGPLGPIRLSSEGFLGLGIRETDRQLLARRHRLVIDTSEFLRRMANVVPGMHYLADSLWVASGGTA